MSAPTKPSNVFEGVSKLSPRMRRAIALYGTAAARTQKEASTLAGMHPQYLTLMLNNNPLAQAELKRVMADVDIETVDMGKKLRELAVRAIARIEETMEAASNETLRFKAAQDLADRGPETSKVQRHQVETFSLNGADVAALASAMVEAAKVREVHSKFSDGSHDFTGVSTPKAISDAGSGSP